MSHVDEAGNIVPSESAEQGESSFTASETNSDSVRRRAEACQWVIVDAVAGKISGRAILDGLQEAGATASEAKDYIDQFKEHLLREKSKVNRSHDAPRSRHSSEPEEPDAGVGEQDGDVT